MSPLGQQGIVIRLQRIPMINIGRAASNPTRESSNTSTNDYLSRISPIEIAIGDSQAGQFGVLVNRLLAQVILNRFVVAADADRIREVGGKHVRFFDSNDLPRRRSLKFNVIEAVGSRVWSLIVHVRSKQPVFFGEIMVHASRKEVLVDDLLA